MTALTQRNRQSHTRRIREGSGRWWLFAGFIIITAVVLIPIAANVWLSLGSDQLTGNADSFSLNNYFHVISSTDVLGWLTNSLIVTGITVVVAVFVAAPAGYVISRARGRLVSSYALILFIVQSLPVITAIIPLFLLFSDLGLVDKLSGLVIVYVGATLSVAIWMMAAYFDSVPIALEEAGWMDGCSVFGGFIRIVLRNSLPGLLSTGIFFLPLGVERLPHCVGIHSFVGKVHASSRS